MREQESLIRRGPVARAARAYSGRLLTALSMDETNAARFCRRLEREMDSKVVSSEAISQRSIVVAGRRQGQSHRLSRLPELQG